MHYNCLLSLFLLQFLVMALIGKVAGELYILWYDDYVVGDC